MAEVPQDCIFCQIANGSVPSKKVYEDASFTAVMDINPANPGHVLLLSKTHVTVFPQLSEEDAGNAGIIVKKLSTAMIKKLGVQGTTTYVANGGSAGQRAPHLIIHVIPRLPGDNLFPPQNLTFLDKPAQAKEPVALAKQEDKTAAPPKKSSLDAITDLLNG